MAPAVFVEPRSAAPWQPPELRDPTVQAAVLAAARRFGLPRWFLYAVIHRESTFERCKVQDEGPAGDSPEDGRGLTQLSFGWYNGFPYPQGNLTPNDRDPKWRANMGLDTTFKGWINMGDVTPLGAPRFRSQAACILAKPSAVPGTDAFDAGANLDRFGSGYAAPQFRLRHRLAPADAPAATLRKVAYYWHYGLWGSRSGDYPADPRPYLPAYDGYVVRYQGPVEAEDGPFDGHVCAPPYDARGCPETAPEPPPPPPLPTVLVATLRVTSDWKTGYCAEVSVRNGTAAPIAWRSLTVEVGDGRVRTGASVWGGVVTGRVTVAPTALTSPVRAGASVNVGLCADRGASGGTATAGAIGY